MRFHTKPPQIGPRTLGRVRISVVDISDNGISLRGTSKSIQLAGTSAEKVHELVVGALKAKMDRKQRR